MVAREFRMDKQMNSENSAFRIPQSAIAKPLRVLIVEDSEDDAFLLLRELHRGGYEPVSERVETAETMRSALKKQEWDIVISDYTLPGFSGIEALNIFKENGSEIPFIIVSGNIGEEIATEAMRFGAHDYIMKGNLKRLIPAVERELRETVMRREKLRLESIAEAANLMTNIGYVFSGIRHEIGNPINAIKMTLNMLKRNYDKYDRAKIMEYIDRALDASGKIEYLLKGLRNFNMFENPDLRDFDLESFFRNFTALITGDLMRKGIAFSSSISPEAKYVYADARALQQVLLNIITNAMDACEGREKPAVDIEVARHFDTISIRVSDNGCGMTEKQQAELFRPFFTNKEKGTGLGLVISRKMIAKMNGDIRITSRKDAGTTVNISLPEGKSGDRLLREKSSHNR